MIRIAQLRQQHDAALAMAARLVDLTNDYVPGRPAYPILMQFNRLVGLLRIHLAQEDVDLYSQLIGSCDPQVARLARTYVEEMGGLAIQLECFARHWSCSASIATNFDEFRDGLHDFLLALAVRIQRENQHLYPLAEAEIRGSRRNAA